MSITETIKENKSKWDLMTILQLEEERAKLKRMATIAYEYRDEEESYGNYDYAQEEQEAAGRYFKESTAIKKYIKQFRK